MAMTPKGRYLNVHCPDSPAAVSRVLGLGSAAHTHSLLPDKYLVLLCQSIIVL